MSNYIGMTRELTPCRHNIEKLFTHLPGKNYQFGRFMSMSGCAHVAGGYGGGGKEIVIFLIVH